MKQHKALDKKGKLKLDKGIALVDVFPSQFKSNITAQFNHCVSEHNDKLKKEPNGCTSWMPFSTCFFEYGRGVKNK